MKLFGLVLVFVLGCGGASRDLREVNRDQLLDAADDPVAIENMFHGSVVDGGLWFANPICEREFGTGGGVPDDRQKQFANCLATLHLQTSARKDMLGDVVVLTYPPGIEVEARLAPEQDGPHLMWIGFASRRANDALLPTITSAALESLRRTGDRNGPLAPITARTLELDPLPTSHAAYSWIRVCLDERGAVTLAEPFETTSTLASSAFSAAASTWKFRPFVLEGHPTAACSMARMTYPPDQGPPDETLPLPPPPSRSRKTPLVFPPDSVAERAIDHHRLMGTTHIVPDDRAKTEIARDHHGHVVASFRICIDETGATESVLPIRSSGVAVYDYVLLGAMNDWSFSPYLVDGVPTPVCTYVTFDYSQR